MKTPRPATIAPRAAGVGAALVALAACTSTPPILPQRDFDRPTDIAFACLGGLDVAPPPAGAADAGVTSPLLLTGRPMPNCHARGLADPPAGPGNRTFAFLPNSNSGEMTVIDADTWQLVDLDPKTAGFGEAPLGEVPEQIMSSDDGCRVITVNHGSCDFTVVDPAALLAPTLHAQYARVPASTGNAPFLRVRPVTPSGRVLPLRAGEVALVPEVVGARGAPAFCGADWKGHEAVVTFPSCNLVALMDMGTGLILDSRYVYGSADGSSVTTVEAGREPVCQVADCGSTFPSAPDASAADSLGGDASNAEASADAVSGDASDGGAGADASSEDGSSDGATAEAGDGGAEAGDGAAATNSSGAAPADAGSPAPVAAKGYHPLALAIAPGASRAYVGLTDASFVLAFDLDLDKKALTPAGGDVAIGVIGLHEGALGVSRLRLSVDPYKPATGGYLGEFVGDDAQRQYLYVIARDGSVRVVAAGNGNGNEHECETSIDPYLIESFPGLHIDDACVPVNPAYRRATALGPGLRIPSTPVDVTVSDIGNTDDHSETSVGGVFAWILGVNGNAYLVNIKPVLRGTTWYEDDGKTQDLCTSNTLADCHPEADPPPNTLRDRNVLSFTTGLDSTAGPARVEFAPTAGATGPRIQNIWTRGSANNAAAYSLDYFHTGVFFPPDAQPLAQTWSVTWEGALLATPRFSGQIVPNKPTDGQALLLDPGADYCRVGLQPNDLVTLRGCADATECGTNQVCAQGTVGTLGAGSLPITGLCLSTTTSTDKCGALLNTVRRYEAHPIDNDTEPLSQSELRLVPHLDEIVLPSRVGCENRTALDGGVGAGDAGTPLDAGLDVAPPDGAARLDFDGGVSEAGSAVMVGSLDDREAALMKLTSTCVDPTDPTTSAFQCYDSGEAPRRVSPSERGAKCLQPCDTPGQQGDCRTGRLCLQRLPKATDADGPCDMHGSSPRCFCAEGPDLTGMDANVTECLGQLFSYQLSVGGGFLVAGSSSGAPLTQSADSSGHCQPLANLDPRLAARISLRDTPWCSLSFDENADGLCDPNDTICSADDLGLLLSTQQQPDLFPNPCLFVGGANDSDPSLVGFPRHIQALFRNSELQFMMTNLEQPVSEGLQINFQVSGGFHPQAINIPGTVELGMPARIVVGPVPTRVVTSTDTHDVPYLFVVDQRRLGRVSGSSPARGQLLRIHPRGLVISSPKTGDQPTYEDLTLSNDLFPIQ